METESEMGLFYWKSILYLLNSEESDFLSGLKLGRFLAGWTNTWIHKQCRHGLDPLLWIIRLLFSSLSKDGSVHSK